MDNNAVNTTPKKKTDILSIVVGAVLALGFLLSVFLGTISFFGDLGYFIDNFKFEYGFNFQSLIQAFFAPASMLLTILAGVLFLAYSALTVVLKGKKINALLVFASVALLLAFLGNAFMDLIFLIPSFKWIVIENFFYWGWEQVLWLVMDSSWCLAAVLGIVCGILKKKVPSLIFGIAGALAGVCALVSYLVLRIPPMFQGYVYSWPLFIMYTLFYISLNVSVIGTLILLRPVKK